MNKKTNFEKLPKNVVPKKYDLVIQPDLQEFQFNGNVLIELDVKEETDTIKLNAHNLTIAGVSFVDVDNLEKPIKSFKTCEKSELLTIFFDSVLPLGIGFLKIDFSGVINDRMYGFYRTKNTSLGSACSDEFAATTHFEATFAREAFPCWDEPAFKAVFNITLIVRKDEIALSNMDVCSETTDRNDSTLRHVKFSPTPLMSTYIIAFFIGKYDYIEKVGANGLLMRVYTPIGKKEHGQFALETMEKVLNYYENYFKIPYPLKKLDLLAVSDFPIGAMENWGLIIYREKCILVDPEATSTRAKQLISLIIAHEISHMWFGNLVTMEWWTDLWLKEGFANCMEYFCVDHIYPEFQIWEQFWADVFNRALICDALDNSHPIEVEVNHPSEINEIFDVISYNKGSSIIRMLHNMIGDKHFRDGLHQYLTKYSYKNTFTEDLWNSFYEASDIPVGNIMSSWTKQKGYPILYVSTEFKDDKLVMNISQKKFCSNSHTTDETKWMIPISVISQTDPTKVIKKFVMNAEEKMSVALENVPANHWVKINPGAIDFYRVQYSSELLQKFISCISDFSLPAIDRLNLLDDNFALVKNGTGCTVETLKLMEAFHNETNYTAWCSIMNCLKDLKILLGGSTAENNLNNFGKKLFLNIYTKLGWDAKPCESQLTVLLRSLVLKCLLMFDDESVLVEANQRFQAHFNNECDLHPDLCNVIFQGAAKKGNEETLDSFFEMYKKTKSQEQRNHIGASFGAFKDPKCIEKILEFAISEHVRLQDMSYIFQSCGCSQNKLAVWNFFKAKRDFFHENFTNGNLLTRLIQSITENFATQELHDDIKLFFKEDSFFKCDRTVQQSLENILINKRWCQQEAEKTIQWLIKNY